MKKKVILNKEDKIKLLNNITCNILNLLELKCISKNIDDYITYLMSKTKLTEQRLRRILKLGIVKSISIDDLIDIANALEVKVEVLLKVDM